MTSRRTLFRNEKVAWIALSVYTAVLYLTLEVSFRLYVSVYDRLGRAFVSAVMNAGFAFVGIVLLLIIVWLYRPPWSGYGAMLLIAAGLAFCLANLPVPAKRFHFFQYAPLTVIVFDLLRFRIRDRGIWIWTLIVVALIGLGDETIQAILPDRHFGVLDLAVNAGAGLLTLGFIGFVIGEENYPFPGLPWHGRPRP